MKIIEVEKTEKSSNPHGIDSRKLYDTTNALAIHITLQPGERLKKHITPVDVFFYVLEGNGEIEIGNEKQKVSADTLIVSPANIMHCWYNNDSTALLRILVVKTPRPTTPTKFLE